MAHCFRWKIILPSAKRLGIDTSDHRLYERDVRRVWLGALTFKKNSDERELLAEAPRSFCVAAGMRLRRCNCSVTSTATPQRLSGRPGSRCGAGI
jgi:hypothetical protein